MLRVFVAELTEQRRALTSITTAPTSRKAHDEIDVNAFYNCAIVAGK